MKHEDLPSHGSSALSPGATTIRSASKEAGSVLTYPDGQLPIEHDAFRRFELDTAPLPPGFRRNCNGLYAETSDSRTEPSWTWISGVIGVVASIKDEAGRPGFEIAYFDTEGQYRTTIVWLAATKSPASVRRHLAENGLRLGKYSGKKPEPLCHFLKQSGASKSKKALTRHGWSQNKVDFLLGSEALGPGHYVAALDSSQSQFKQVGSIESWHQANGKLLHDSEIALFVVCYALAGPVWELLGVKAPGVHLYGLDTITKRFLVDLANSLFGDPSDLYFAWNMTRSAAETRRIERNNCFVAFDDLTGTRKHQAAVIARNLSHGAALARTVCSGQVRQKEAWNLSVISTGCAPINSERIVPWADHLLDFEEQIVSIPINQSSISGNVSDVSRLRKEKLFEEVASSSLAWPGYGTVGRACIDGLIADQVAILSKIKREREQLAQSMHRDANPHPSHSHDASFFDLLEATGRVFAQLGYLPIGEDLVSRSIRAVALVRKESLPLAGCERYAGFVSRLHEVFRQAQNSTEDDGSARDGTVIINDSGAYIASSNLEKVFTYWLDSEADHTHLSYQAVRLELTRLGVIIRAENGSLSSIKRYDKKQIRVIRIDKNRLQDLARSLSNIARSTKRIRTEFSKVSSRNPLPELREKLAEKSSEVRCHD